MRLAKQRNPTSPGRTSRLHRGGSGASDEASAETAFWRNADALYRFLYSRTGNREDAEHLTAEVFVTAQWYADRGLPEAQSMDRLQERAREALANYRRSSVAERTGPEPDEATQAAAVEAADSGFSMAILAALPGPYREVLELTLLRGHSAEDAAKQTGVTVAGIHRIQRRALGRAVTLIRGTCDGDAAQSDPLRLPRCEPPAISTKPARACCTG